MERDRSLKLLINIDLDRMGNKTKVVRRVANYLTSFYTEVYAFQAVSESFLKDQNLKKRDFDLLVVLIQDNIEKNF